MSDSTYLNEFIVDSCDTIPVDKALNSYFKIIDVRSPSEFANGSIPFSINIPLFDNIERHEIGYLYKQAGRNKAISHGLACIEPRLDKYLKSFFPFKKNSLVIVCARGGMRSKSVVNLLKKYDFDVKQLIGGYKNYRQFINKEIDKYSHPFIVLHGKTGVGKTRIISQLSNSIDLEGLAQHRSSIFGAINKIPRKQKNFESLLYHQIKTYFETKYVFIEGESRKVGNVFIPKNIFSLMKNGVFVLLSASLETRIQRILDDYNIQDDNTLNEVNRIIQSLSMHLSKKKVDWLSSCLNKGNFYDIAKTLLTEYYDPRYAFGMQKYQYLTEISTEDINDAITQLYGFRRSLIDP